MLRTITVAAAAAFASATLMQAGSDWDFPNLVTVEHPQASYAPSSSPATYPDETGFRERARIVLEGVADGDLMTWRRGYFTGGDPGKYLPGHVMARLILGKEDPDIQRLMNDERSPREHYHFAAHNWARFLPLFGDGILTEETRKELADRAAGYTAYHSGGGTENHVTQWRTSALVLPHYLEGDGQLGRRYKEDVLGGMKDWLRNYVKGLYAGGQGEWDSSTYMIYTVNGLLNIYDFSPDEEARLIARAGLDWFAAQYSLKYRDGVFTAPNQRGYAEGPHDTIADETGFIWYGSSASITPADTRGWRYTNHAITSSWRPNGVFTNIARKNLPDLPAEFRNSKPNYWGTTGEPRASHMHETVYLSHHYTLASLWNGHGSQMTRFQLVADGPDGGIVFWGGNPRKSDHNGNIIGLGYKDGIGRYDQMAQSGRTLVHMSRAPEDEKEADYSFFVLPDGIRDPIERNGWHFIEAANTFLAIKSLGAAAVLDSVDDRYRVLKFPGKISGFVVETGDRKEFSTFGAFVGAVADRTKVEAAGFLPDARASVTNLDGARLQMTFNPAEDGRHGDNKAEVSINGDPVEFGNWAVYDGPFIQQRDSILKVTDGTNAFTIDFSGDLPEYRP